jgi:hypothetical protein
MKHMKKLLALLLALTLACGLLPAAFAAAPAEPAEPDAWEVAINAAYFPDANFRAFVKQYDTDNNDSLSTAELAAVKTMGCSAKSITTLWGIEYFTALTYLDCGSNRLSALDLSRNTALTWVSCSGNHVTSLNLSNNTALTHLECADNQLTSLDVSNNTALKALWCKNNALTSLDVSKNTALTQLDCFNNQLTSLDLSKNTALETLDCSYNQLTSLNLGENAALRQLVCYNNHLTSLDVSRVPFLKDAVENGTKDSSDSGRDWYSSAQGVLCVDKTVTIITDHSTDLGGFTFDFRSGPVEHPGFAIGLELVVMLNQGDIGMSSGGYNVSLLDLDLDGHSDVRIYSKNGTFYFYVDARTNLRGTYTLTVSEAVKNAFASNGIDYYSSFTFQYPSPWNPFTDVKEGKDYYDAILWAYYHDPQVTAGVTATTFGVGKAVKRADAMFYLWVAAGKPEPTLTKSPFTDVSDPKAYYYKAVMWAWENGIDKGADGMFNGKSDCLRETVVLWMYRTLQGKALAE